MTVDYKRSKFMSDALLENATSLGVAPSSLVSNVARSGQLGTGIRMAKLDGATPAVFSPVVPVVLSVPSMWDPYPKLQEMLKALMETHAKSITGIDFSYTLETQDAYTFHDGQTLATPTRTTRSAVNPTATFQEYPGLPVWNLFRTWMFDIQHPDTNASNLPSKLADNSDIPGWYVSAYSMSMLFIQFDPSGLPDRIYDAVVITNMVPKEIGEIGMERTIGTVQLKERSISFTGIVQHNENTRELGYRVARMLQMERIAYDFSLPGYGGTVDPSTAIQSDIQHFGGLHYEATGADSGVEGALTQFRSLSSEGNDAFYDRLQPGSTSIVATGAAESDVAGGGGGTSTTV